MADRLQLQVILDAIDKASPTLKGIVKNAGEFKDKFGEAENAVKSLQKQQQSFAHMRDLQTRLNENGAALKSAKSSLEIYTAQIKRGGDAAKAVGKPYREAQERVKALTAEHAKLTDKAKQMRQALTASGVKNLADAETQVAAKIKETNALLDKRRAGLERISRLNEKHKASMMRMAGITALGYGMVAATRKAAGMGGTAVNAFRDQEDASISLKTGMMRADGSTHPDYEKLLAQARVAGGMLPGGTGEAIDMMTALQRQGVSAKAILGGLADASAQLAVQLKMPANEAAGMAVQLQKVTRTASKDFPALADTIQRAYHLGIDPENLLGGFSSLAAALPAINQKGKQAVDTFMPMLAQLNSAGLSGDSAGKGIAKVMQSALNPTRMRKASAAAGVRLDFTDGKGNFGGVEQFYAQIAKIRRMTDVQRAAVFREMGVKDAETQKALLALAVSGYAGYEKAAAKLGQQASLQQRVAEQSKTISHLWSAAQGAGKDILSSIGEVVGDDVKKVAKWLTETGDRISKWIRENKELARVLALVGAAALGFVGLVGTVLMTFGPLMLMKFLVTRVAFSFLGLGSPITAAVSLLGKLGPVLKLVSMGLWGMTKAAMAFLFTPVGAALALLAVAAYMVWKNWDGIVGGATIICQQIGELWDGAIAWIKSIWNSSVMAVLDVVDQIVAAWDSGMEFVKNIGDALAGLPGKFFEIGAQVVAGILNGIVSKAKALKDGVVGMASDIAGWFGDKLLIRSPSRVFMEMGLHIPEGVAQGIDRGRKLVGGAALGMAAATLAPMNASAADISGALKRILELQIQQAMTTAQSAPLRPAGAGAAPMGGASYSIVINAQPGQDPQAIARAVSAELDRRERAQRGSVLSQLSDME